jgi:hypothetical protein
MFVERHKSQQKRWFLLGENENGITRNNVIKLWGSKYPEVTRWLGKLQIKNEHKKPTKEDLRKLWNYAQNLRDKSLITFVNSTALAKETLSKLELRYFEEYWEKKDLPYIDCPPEILKGHGIGRYRGVRQITFLTPGLNVISSITRNGSRNA